MPRKAAKTSTPRARTSTPKTPIANKEKTYAGRGRPKKKTPDALGPTCETLANERRLITMNRSAITRNSPLPGSLTPQERLNRIQEYVNSIQPSLIRVDYEKTPKKNIITKLPRNSIVMPTSTEDKKLRLLLEKFKKPRQKTIMMRVDYDKENADEAVPGPSSEEEQEQEMNVDLDTETNGMMTYEEFCRKSLAQRSSPQPSTSKQGLLEVVPENDDSKAELEVVEESIFVVPAMNSTFITKRTPAAKNARKTTDDDVVEVPVVPEQHPVVVILDDSDPDDSIQIVSEQKPVSGRELRSKRRDLVKLESASETESREPKTSSAANNGEGSDCPICLQSYDLKAISSTICGHVFCTECIKATVKSKRSCPICRKPLTMKKIHPLYL